MCGCFKGGYSQGGVVGTPPGHAADPHYTQVHFPQQGKLLRFAAVLIQPTCNMAGVAALPGNTVFRTQLLFTAVLVWPAVLV